MRSALPDHAIPLGCRRLPSSGGALQHALAVQAVVDVPDQQGIQGCIPDLLRAQRGRRPVGQRDLRWAGRVGGAVGPAGIPCTLRCG